MRGVIGSVGTLSATQAANDARIRRRHGEHGNRGDLRALVAVMRELFPDAGCRRLAGMLGLAKSTVQAHLRAIDVARGMQ